MIDLIVNAFILGSLLSLFIGPVFFMLIQASIEKGFKGGLAILFGLYLSDFLYVLLTYHFFEYLIDLEIPENKLKLVGGVIFIVIGLFYILRKSSLKKSENRTKNKSLKSFIINTINPSVFFFWFAAISWGNEKFQGNVLILYLLLGLFFAFAFDCLKIYFSIKIFRLLNNSSNFNLNRIIGFCILIIGVFLTYQNV